MGWVRSPSTRLREATKFSTEADRKIAASSIVSSTVTAGTDSLEVDLDCSFL